MQRMVYGNRKRSPFQKKGSEPSETPMKLHRLLNKRILIKWNKGKSEIEEEKDGKEVKGRQMERSQEAFYVTHEVD